MCKDLGVSKVDCPDPPANPQVEVEGWTGGVGILPAPQRARLRRGVAGRLGLRLPRVVAAADPGWAAGTTRGSRALLFAVARSRVTRLLGSEPLVLCRVFPEFPLHGRCVGCEECPLAG